MTNGDTVEPYSVPRKMAGLRVEDIMIDVLKPDCPLCLAERQKLIHGQVAIWTMKLKNTGA